jgi:hypothetical protein
MTLHSLLFNLSLIITVAADIAVLFAVYPAFKRTKNKAFLLLGFAFLLGLFDTICDHTIALDAYRIGPQTFLAYYVLRKFSSFAVTLLDAAGVILLTRAFMASHTPSRE